MTFHKTSQRQMSIKKREREVAVMEKRQEKMEKKEQRKLLKMEGNNKIKENEENII